MTLNKLAIALISAAIAHLVFSPMLPQIGETIGRTLEHLIH